MKAKIFTHLKYNLSFLPIVVLLIICPSCKTDNPDQIVADFKLTLELMKEYDYGKSHAWLGDFQHIMSKIYNNPDIYEKVEPLMIDALSNEISSAAKQMICSFLGPIASAKAIPVLKQMLSDEKLYASSLSVLQQISAQEVHLTLEQALLVAKGLTKVGIINVIAERNDPGAIQMIPELIFDEDSLVSRAAISALGKIGTEEAANSLEKAFENTDIPLKWDIADAMLLCADNMIDTNVDHALSIYLKIYDACPPPSILFATLNGPLQCNEANGISLVYAVMTTFDDPESQTVTMPLVRDLEDGTDISPFYEYLPSMGDYQQMQLFTAIADRNDGIVKNVIKEAVNHGNPYIRLAALMALRKIGNAEDIEFLATTASKTRGRERDMARECLAILKGKDIDDMIILGLQNPEPKIRIEYIRSIGERNLTAGIEPVLQSLQDPDRKVRLESYKVLGKLAGPDKLKEILEISLNAGTSAERKEAERTLTLIALKILNEDIRANEILNSIHGVKDEASLVMLIQTLGNIGSKPALPVIQDYLMGDNAEVQIAAIKALSVWPDSDPLNDLKTIVESSDDIKAHNLAMRGYIRMIQIDDKMTEDQKSKECLYAFGLAKNLDEQRIVISGIAEIRTKGTLQLAVGLLDNPDLKAEAEAAISGIAGPLGRTHPEYTKEELNKLIESTDNPEFKSRLQNILKWME